MKEQRQSLEVLQVNGYNRPKVEQFADKALNGSILGSPVKYRDLPRTVLTDEVRENFLREGSGIRGPRYQRA
jgi:hypothetical protein